MVSKVTTTILDLEEDAQVIAALVSLKERGKPQEVSEVKERGKTQDVREVKERGKTQDVREVKERGKTQDVREVAKRKLSTEKILPQEVSRKTRVILPKREPPKKIDVKQFLGPYSETNVPVDLSGGRIPAIRYENGNYYGHQKNGLRHGYGSFETYTGRIEHGTWENNLLHGKDCYIIEGNTVLLGEFRNGVHYTGVVKVNNQTILQIKEGQAYPVFTNPSSSSNKLSLLKPSY